MANRTMTERRWTVYLLRAVLNGYQSGGLHTSVTLAADGGVVAVFMRRAGAAAASHAWSS